MSHSNSFIKTGRSGHFPRISGLKVSHAKLWRWLNPDSKTWFITYLSGLSSDLLFSLLKIPYEPFVQTGRTFLLSTSTCLLDKWNFTTYHIHLISEIILPIKIHNTYSEVPPILLILYPFIPERKNLCQHGLTNLGR